MNLSGSAVQAVASYYKIKPEEILVVHDELDLHPGTMRLKLGGGNAGHNGLKDITAKLSTPNFWRLRVGIGHPRQYCPQQQVYDWVLGTQAPSIRRQSTNASRPRSSGSRALRAATSSACTARCSSSPTPSLQQRRGRLQERLQGRHTDSGLIPFLFHCPSKRPAPKQALKQRRHGTLAMLYVYLLTTTMAIELLMSSCLIGQCCRWDAKNGRSVVTPRLHLMLNHGQVAVICPNAPGVWTCRVLPPKSNRAKTQPTCSRAMRA